MQATIRAPQARLPQAARVRRPPAVLPSRRRGRRVFTQSSTHSRRPTAGRLWHEARNKQENVCRFHGPCELSGTSSADPLDATAESGSPARHFSSHRMTLAARRFLCDGGRGLWCRRAKPFLQPPCLLLLLLLLQSPCFARRELRVNRARVLRERVLRRKVVSRSGSCCGGNPFSPSVRSVVATRAVDERAVRAGREAERRLSRMAGKGQTPASLEGYNTSTRAASGANATFGRASLGLFFLL